MWDLKIENMKKQKFEVVAVPGPLAAGECLCHNNEWYFIPNNRYYYTSWETYKNDWNKMCYAPIVDIRKPDLWVEWQTQNIVMQAPCYSFSRGYTHHELYEMFYQNEKYCDKMFSYLLVGADPKLMLNAGVKKNDLLECWDFVTPGKRVGYKNHDYIVTSVPPKNIWNMDTMVDLAAVGAFTLVKGVRLIDLTWPDEIYLGEDY